MTARRILRHSGPQVRTLRPATPGLLGCTGFPHTTQTRISRHPPHPHARHKHQGSVDSHATPPLSPGQGKGLLRILQPVLIHRPIPEPHPRHGPHPLRHPPRRRHNHLQSLRTVPRAPGPRHRRTPGPPLPHPNPKRQPTHNRTPKPNTTRTEAQHRPSGPTPPGTTAAPRTACPAPTRAPPLSPILGT